MNKLTRRKFVTGAATLAGGAAVLHKLDAQVQTREPDKPREKTAAAQGKPFIDQKPMPPGKPNEDYTPVVTPNGSTLPWKIVDGVKVYHLIAEPVQNHEF